MRGKVPNAVKYTVIAACVIMLILSLRDTDFSAFENLSLSDILPILVIAVVIFALKTGILTALILGIRKLIKLIFKK